VRSASPVKILKARNARDCAGVLLREQSTLPAAVRAAGAPAWPDGD